ncbi:hypothetical protein KJ991_02920 [Patescibacteria group bacterium]|nr:hypothetical protein [Patescibacteria group bacterium]MBU4057699.1 hypothetical protein [Patescibacteria group bacterium]MBU4115642.1 hypothetical protein [Patescibacteria group bacterium]
MPNIEIHGLNRFNADAVKVRIDTAMQKSGFGDKAITTTYNDDTVGCEGEILPYLRIYSSEDNGEYIAARILEANIVMDIEIAKLEKFIPAKK